MEETIPQFLRDVQDGCIDKAYDSSFLRGMSTQELLTSSNRHGDTALLIAARFGHEQLLRTLVDVHGVNLEITNVDGKTGLHEAAQQGHSDCVVYLLQKGAKVDSLKRADW